MEATLELLVVYRISPLLRELGRLIKNGACRYSTCDCATPSPLNSGVAGVEKIEAKARTGRTDFVAVFTSSAERAVDGFTPTAFTVEPSDDDQYELVVLSGVYGVDTEAAKEPAPDTTVSSSFFDGKYQSEMPFTT